jgi:DNA-binding MarR family transcriptional regulator
LYFKIAQQVMRAGTSAPSLKDLHVDAHLSERAIRLKLRDFEREGWIESVITPADKRTRRLVVTPKLLALIQAHAQALDQSLGQALLVIAKNQ